MNYLDTKFKCTASMMYFAIKLKAKFIFNAAANFLFFKEKNRLKEFCTLFKRNIISRHIMTQNCAVSRQLPPHTFLNAVAVITGLIKRKVTKMGYLLYTCNGIMTIPVFQKNYQMIRI
jgi:hypothetical protein